MRCTLALAAMLATVGSALAASPGPLRAKQVATWGVPALWHSDSIAAVAFSQDGQRVLVASMDGSFTSWELASFQRQEFIETGYAAVAAAFASTGRVALARGLDGGGSIEIWDHLGGAHSWIPGPDSNIRALSFSADGTRLAAGADSGPVLLWELSRKQRVRKLRGPTWRTFSVAVSADGSRVVGSGDKGRVWVWDASNGRLLRTLQAGSNNVLAVAVSADGQRVLSGGEDSIARLWDVSSGKVLWSSNEEADVQAVALAPDGSRAVTVGKALKLWGLPRGEVIAKLDRGIGQPLALSADGSLAAIGYGRELRFLEARSS